MGQRNRWGWWLAAVLCLLLAMPGPAAAKGTITVFAAASLADSFRELGRRFEAAHPDQTVRVHLAGSQQLVQQIGRGAPADVLAVAGEAPMRDAVRSGKVHLDTVRPFAWNDLIVAVAPQQVGKLDALADLAEPGTKVVLAARAVPAGRYAHDFLAKASTPDGLGADYGRRVLANVVSYELDVRAVLTKVALGEADAGLVYASDVQGPTGAKVGRLPIPADVNVQATYPIGLVAASRQPVAARAFIDYVTSAEGQLVMSRHGFRTAPGARPYGRRGAPVR